ncbi:MAG: enoyl-CoA hydratase/isomerase family protein [Candidatus Kariarchaeaceae archaeon]|jgi:enoyl-CoA hydratase
MYKNLNFEIKDEGIAIITFTREKALNALNNETVKELEQIINTVEENSSIRVLVFQGSGKAFIAGADITEFKGRTVVETKTFSQYLQNVYNRIEKLPLPMIAAINGYCLGGGLELAMACDFRIASTKAIFGQPEIKLGLIPGAGGTQRLPRLIGKTMAKELILLGESINAEKALSIGLVNTVVDPEKLVMTAMEYAQKLTRGSRFAITQAKEAVNRGIEMAWLDALELESDLFVLCYSHEDFNEGVSAFLEKRTPNFK